MSRPRRGARAALAGGARAWARYRGGEAEGRAACLALRGRELPEYARLYWAHADGVPDDLRREVPPPDPRLIFVGMGPSGETVDPENAAEYERQKRIYEEHREARRRWLALAPRS